MLYIHTSSHEDATPKFELFNFDKFDVIPLNYALVKVPVEFV